MSRRVSVVVSLLVLALVAGFLLSRSEPEPTPDTEDAQTARGDAKARSVARELEGAAVVGTRVSGLVHDEDGSPIAGARVCLDIDRARSRGRAPLWPTCTTSGADGRYAMNEVGPWMISVRASARGFIPNSWTARTTNNRPERSVQLVAGEDVSDLDVELTAGGVRVAGVVEDVSGGAIEGAWVSVGNGGRWARRNVGTWSTTDAEGRFEAWVGPDATGVIARAEGYTRAYKSTFAPDENVRILLTPESVIVGQVVLADDGTPVEGVEVGTSAWNSDRNVVTDDGGQFRIEGLSPGRYSVRATADELFGKSGEKVHVGFGETSEPVTIRVHPAFHIRGRIVIGDQDDAPCRESWVRLRDDPGMLRASGDADDEGRIDIPGVQPGNYEVTVGCAGFVPADAYDPVVIADASVDGLVWKVTTGKVLRGRVVDPSGAPVDEVSIGVSPAVRRGGASQNGYSNAEGEFEIAGLGSGEVDVRASTMTNAGLPTPMRITIPEAADPDPIVIELPAAGRIEGTVVGADGTGVGGITVRTKFGGTSSRWGNSTTTASDGSFAVARLQVGEHRVTANTGWADALRAPGSTDDDVQGELVAVTADRPAIVKLVVEARDSSVTGTVTTSAGEAVADAFVTVQRIKESAASTGGSAARRTQWGSWGTDPVLTDHDGRFAVGGLSEGRYAVRAFRKNGGEAIGEADTGTELALVIEDTATLSGTVVVAGGDPPRRFGISLQDEQSGVWRSDEFFRTGGAWSFSQLPAGTYELHLDAPEGNVTEEGVTVEAGADRSGLELRLDPKIELRGRLLDLDTQQPVARVRVSAGTPGSISLGGNPKPDDPGVTGGDGRFTVPDAPSGEIFLIVRPLDARDPETNYDMQFIRRRVPGGVAEHDLGDIELVRRRLDEGEKAGDLGFKLTEAPPDLDPEDRTFDVAFVRPAGPADVAGMKAGDRIVSVDGHGVDGNAVFNYRFLTQVPEGRAISFGLEGGRTARVVAGPALDG